MNQILIAHFRLRPETLKMIFVLLGAFHIHVSRIPVTRADSRLWSPMRPNPKLRFTKPRGNPIFLKRLTRPAELSRRHLRERLAHASRDQHGTSRGPDHFQ